jgi:hypothetical protein
MITGRTCAITLLVALAACKTKESKPAPVVVTPTTMPAGSGSGSAPTTDTPRPALPDVKQAPTPAEPMTVDDARAALPKIEGTVVLELKQTSDHRQVHGTWCIDGAGAQDVARLVGQWMAEAGYSALSIRGDDRKAGVSGDKGSIRMSMIVSASGAASCAAPAHYFASATIFRP